MTGQVEMFAGGITLSTCAACDGVCRACDGALRDHLGDGRICTVCGHWTHADQHHHDVAQCEHTRFVDEVGTVVRCTADGFCCPWDDREGRERRWCQDHCPECAS